MQGTRRCRVRSRFRVPGVQLLPCMRPLVGGTKSDPLCVAEVRFLKFLILNRTSQPAGRPPNFRTRARVCKDPLEYTRREKERGSRRKGAAGRAGQPAFYTALQMGARSAAAGLQRPCRRCQPLYSSGRASGAAPGLQWPHRCGARPSYFFMGGCDAARVFGAGGEPVMA